MVPGPVALALPRSLLQMQCLGPHLDLVNQSLHFHRSSGMLMHPGDGGAGISLTLMWRGPIKLHFLILEMLIKDLFIVGLLCLFSCYKSIASMMEHHNIEPPCGKRRL